MGYIVVFLTFLFFMQILISLIFKNNISKKEFIALSTLNMTDLLFIIGFVMSVSFNGPLILAKIFIYLSFFNYSIFFYLYSILLKNSKKKEAKIALVILALFPLFITFLGDRFGQVFMIIIASLIPLSTSILLFGKRNYSSRKINLLVYLLTLNEIFRLFINIFLLHQLFYTDTVFIWLLLLSFTLKTLTLFVIVEINNIISTNKNLLTILDNINSTSLLNTTFNEHPDAVVITDVKKKIIYLNPKAAKMTGYAESEVIGKNPKMFSSNLTPRSTYDNLYASLKNNNTWSGEFINKKKSGEIFTEHAKIVTIKDVNGNVIYYMAIKTDISKEKDYLNRLEYLSKHDDLTGLYRRGTFINLVEESLLTKFSVNKFFISVDIDNFKNINDIYGHMIGDEALILFSKSITEIFNENSYICRFGGDEFSLYIYDKTVNEINDLFKQLFEKLALTPVKISNNEIYISVSVGANMIDNGDPFQVIYEKSDMLLYEAKKIKGSSIKKDF